MDKLQQAMLLELSEKDIKKLKTVRKVLDEYNKLNLKLTTDLITRMKANGITELGDLKLVKEEKFIGMEIFELNKTFLDQTMLDRIIVTVDIDKTVENLKEYGYTDVHIKPLVEHLNRWVDSILVERLVIDESNGVGKWYKKCKLCNFW